MARVLSEELTNYQYDFNAMMEGFSVDDFPDFYNHPVAYKAYVFMIPPKLNLFDGNNIRSEIQEIPDFHPLVSDNVGKSIARSLTANSILPFIPYFTKRVTSYGLANENIRAVERMATIYGHSIKYYRFSEDFRKGGSTSLAFKNDRFRTMDRMASIWIKYIQHVTKTGVLKPERSTVINRELDYVGTLVYLVTRVDSNQLVYWEGLYGVAPTENDIESFSFDNKDLIHSEDLSLSFDYSIRSRPYDINVLADINEQTKNFSRNYIKLSKWTEMNFDLSRGPYITYENGIYRLNWTR